MTDSDTYLLIRAARAIDKRSVAADCVQAADEGHDIAGNAIQPCWDAASTLRTVGERFIDLADQATFSARRMERAQRDENRTGVEHRGGSAA